MIKYHYRNWLDFSPNKIDMILNEYPLKNHPIGNSLLDTMIMQADLIANTTDSEHLTLFMSGGIDSQMMAQAFVLAKIKKPIKYLFYKINYNGNYNKTELVYAKIFAKKYNIDLFVYEITVTDQQLLDKIKSKEYITTKTGIANLFLIEIEKKYKQQYPNELIVKATGNFTFFRENNKCFGLIPHPQTGTISGTEHDTVVGFYYFSPLIFQHYEKLHRSEEELQYPTLYQAKNLAFTELGFYLRAKWYSTEQFYNYPFRTQDMTVLDFGDDHATNNEQRTILNMKCMVGRDNKYKENILKLMAHRQSTLETKKKYFKLYEFDTNVEKV